MGTNIEARALADILYEMTGTHVEQEYDRETAAEARAGGRQLTKTLAEKLAQYGQVFVDRMAVDHAHTWHYQIDPAGSYIHGDERREPEAREAWARIARYHVDDESYARTRIYLDQAEEMIGWPIYRAGIIAQIRDTIDSTGRSTMRGLTSEQLDQLDELGSRLFDEKSYVAGFMAGGANERANGPVVNGERFAPGYTPEAAEYEQSTR